MCVPDQQGSGKVFFQNVARALWSQSLLLDQGITEQNHEVSKIQRMRVPDQHDSRKVFFLQNVEALWTQSLLNVFYLVFILVLKALQ